MGRTRRLANFRGTREEQRPPDFQGPITEARQVGFAKLAVDADTAVRVADLPMHHGDPFDRLLVAQAMAGPMRLLTSNAVLARYSELVAVVG